MTCERFRPLLALLIGNDLDTREAAEVRQHLSDCAGCQRHWEGLQTAIGALQLVSRDTVLPERGSLRALVTRRMNNQIVKVPESAPGWLTLGAFATACAAVLWLTVSTPVFDFDFRDAQLAETDGISLPIARPMGSQGPQIQFVDDTQPAIPVQFTPHGIDYYGGQPVVAPRLFGGPRSF